MRLFESNFRDFSALDAKLRQSVSALTRLVAVGQPRKRAYCRPGSAPVRKAAALRCYGDDGDDVGIVEEVIFLTQMTFRS